MDSTTAVAMLGALAQETRLEAFRRLIEAAPEGLPAGVLGERLGLAPATLSFHLKELRHAGLVRPRRAGRSIIYAPELGAMNDLLRFLMEDCCRGACAPRGGKR